MLTEAEIRENLLDAGCSEKEMKAILKPLVSGDLRKAGEQIEACRKKQLEILHESQRCIDCLDYLSYRIRA
ncbi:MAG: hypothetical protein Q4D71_09365 [Oscillospiraceae bacterium]|nr:hypothetical protein [Oscillospiraceae bacterium]